VNYLAHALLSQSDEPALIGNIAGDHVKGRLEGRALHPGVLRGLRRHRAVDALSDRHPATEAPRALFPQGQRRFAGILLDVLFDHLLTRHWSRFSREPLAQFQARVYRVIEARASLLPDGFQRIGPGWARARWLTAYESIDGVAAVIDRMAARRDSARALQHLLDRALTQEAVIEEAFLRLFPDLIRAQGADLAPHVISPQGEDER
jgi:acyl carrier protein phosphodiesterase